MSSKMFFSNTLAKLDLLLNLKYYIKNEIDLKTQKIGKMFILQPYLVKKKHKLQLNWQGQGKVQLEKDGNRIFLNEHLEVS